MQLIPSTVRIMAIYRSCKPFLTGSAIAASLLFFAGCSHDMHTDEQISAQSAQTASDVSTDGHSAHDHTHDHSGSKEKGVSTNHDVFHSKSLEVPAGTTVPGLTVEVDEDSVRGWNLYVGTANFTFEPSKVNGESLPTEGHAHLYINDEPIQRIYGPWTHLPELPPGTNEIRVTLNANGHETLTTQGKPIEESVTVEVYDPNAATTN